LLSWGELDVNFPAADWIARVDLDRLLEHRCDPERVDRAHRLHLMLAVDPHPVAAVAGRERVGNGRAAAVVDVNEVFAREADQSVVRIPTTAQKSPSGTHGVERDVDLQARCGSAKAHERRAELAPEIGRHELTGFAVTLREPFLKQPRFEPRGSHALRRRVGRLQRE
jgi:hypothetical protein